MDRSTRTDAAARSPERNRIAMSGVGNMGKNDTENIERDKKLEDVKIKNDLLESQVADLQSENKLLRDQIINLHHKLQQAHVELQNSNKELQESKGKVNELLLQMQSHQSDHELLNAKYETLYSKYEKLQIDNAGLKMQLNSLLADQKMSNLNARRAKDEANNTFDFLRSKIAELTSERDALQMKSSFLRVFGDCVGSLYEEVTIKLEGRGHNFDSWNAVALGLRKQRKAKSTELQQHINAVVVELGFPLPSWRRLIDFKWDRNNACHCDKKLLSEGRRLMKRLPSEYEHIEDDFTRLLTFLESNTVTEE
eukprot:GILK01005452.1.p1 GENE.GILK01005452.1~~GILK01005452.1.p1  ORF type:complete len:310 (-),score=53.35 GILK01005452.1:52-981(-)